MTTELLSVLVLFGSASVHKLEGTKQKVTGATDTNWSVPMDKVRKSCVAARGVPVQRQVPQKVPGTTDLGTPLPRRALAPETGVTQCGRTDTCENITFALTSYAGSKKKA